MDIKDLHSENDKTLKKVIEEDAHKWRHMPCSWIGRMIIIKMSILPKPTYTFNAILIKTPIVSFIEQNKYSKNV